MKKASYDYENPIQKVYKIVKPLATVYDKIILTIKLGGGYFHRIDTYISAGK